MQLSPSLYVCVSEDDNDHASRDARCGETRRLSCPRGDGAEGETCLAFHQGPLMSVLLGKGCEEAEGSDSQASTLTGVPAPPLT